MHEFAAAESCISAASISVQKRNNPAHEVHGAAALPDESDRTSAATRLLADLPAWRNPAGWPMHSALAQQLARLISRCPQPHMAYLQGATFVADWRPFARPLDRNARAKIIMLAEALERRTESAGRRNGIVSIPGLIVLRCLLFRYLGKSGLLCPSYATLQAAAGLRRQSIANALARLEASGILKITRRLCRQRVARVSPITGLDEVIVATTQASSLYSVHEPGAWADHLARPTGRRAPFPARRQLALLERMVLTWTARLKLSEQSPRRREEPRAAVRRCRPVPAGGVAMSRPRAGLRGRLRPQFTAHCPHAADATLPYVAEQATDGLTWNVPAGSPRHRRPSTTEVAQVAQITVRAPLMHDPRAVANLILDEADRLGLTVTNAALQKLLYSPTACTWFSIGNPSCQAFSKPGRSGRCTRPSIIASRAPAISQSRSERTGSM